MGWGKHGRVEKAQTLESGKMEVESKQPAEAVALGKYCVVFFFNFRFETNFGLPESHRYT